MRTAKIVDSSRELTAKERVAMKSKADMIMLNTACDIEALVIKPVLWAVVEVQVDEEEPYYNYVIVDADGTKYYTGSESLWNAFMEIYNEMSAEPDTEYSVKVFKCNSKNRDGQKFITCSII